MAPWVDPPARPARATPTASEIASDLQATTAAVMLASTTETNKFQMPSMMMPPSVREQDRQRWLVINTLDSVHDPVTRHKMMEKFAALRGEKLESFINNSHWRGKRDRAQALDLISPEREQAERNLQNKSPAELERMKLKAHQRAERILKQTRDPDANDADVRAHLISDELAPQTREELEMTRWAIRDNGGQALYQEIDTTLSSGNEDEALAGLKGDPVHTATIQLKNADGDPARTKEVLRGLKPEQLADWKIRTKTFNVDELTSGMAEADRKEIAKLFAGDQGGATAERFRDLLTHPYAVQPTMLFGPEREHAEKMSDAREPKHVLAELKSLSPEELHAARAAWDANAAAHGGQTWEQAFEKRFADEDRAMRLRLLAAARGDKTTEKAVALRAAMQNGDQKGIEAVLANPDLRSADPAKRAKAIGDKISLTAKVSELDALEQQKHGGTGRSLEQQLDEAYQPPRQVEIEPWSQLPGFDLENDESRAEKRRAAQELLTSGKLSRVTELYRAQEGDDDKRQADLIDGIPTTQELHQIEAAFATRYHRPLMKAPDMEEYKAKARVEQIFGRGLFAPAQAPLEGAALEAEAAKLARADLNAEELRIEHTRETGTAHDERSPEVLVREAQELRDKQYSSWFAGSENGRAEYGGNLGLTHLADHQIGNLRGMLGEHGGLAPGESPAEFLQINHNFSDTMEAQREAKQRMANHVADVFSTIGKLAAIVAMQPELAALINLATGIGAMAIKKQIAGEAYNGEHDAAMVTINLALDAAQIRIGNIGGSAKAVGERALMSEGERIVALKSIERLKLGLSVGSEAAADVATGIVEGQSPTEILEGVVKSGLANVLPGELAGRVHGAIGDATKASRVLREVVAFSTEVGGTALIEGTDPHVLLEAAATAGVNAHSRHRAKAQAKESPAPAPAEDLSVRNAIDRNTGVDKGPEYELFRADMAQFYANQEREAANVTHVRERHGDAAIAPQAHASWDSSFYSREFSYDNANLTVIGTDVHLQPEHGVTPEQLESVRSNAYKGVDRVYNFASPDDDGAGRLHKLPNGNVLQFEPRFVDDPGAANLNVNVTERFDPMTGDPMPTHMTRWVVGDVAAPGKKSENTVAHELSHVVGLPDEYHDPRFASRATPTSPMVFKDGSIMGAFPREGDHPELKSRHLDEIGDSIEDGKRAQARANATTQQLPALDADVQPPFASPAREVTAREGMATINEGVYEAMGSYDERRARMEELRTGRTDLGTITSDQMVAIEGYTAADFRDINEVMRKPDADPAKTAALQDYVATLRAGLSALPAYDGEVYRGAAVSAGTFAKYKQAFEGGGTVSDAAFSSASVNSEIAENFLARSRSKHEDKIPLFAKIQSRTGKEINFLSNAPAEQEVLFDGGAKFKIVHMDEVIGDDGLPRTEVYLREVVDEAP